MRGEKKGLKFKSPFPPLRKISPIHTRAYQMRKRINGECKRVSKKQRKASFLSISNQATRAAGVAISGSSIVLLASSEPSKAVGPSDLLNG